jgi:glycosyltransferase involved in cell wall biosynthesis
MRVLILHSELGVLRGGGENFTRNLFSAFAGRGHHVAAAFVADRRSRYPIPLPSCIKPIPLPGWWSRKLGQATLSSIGLRIPPASRLRMEWDRIQEAISWRTIRSHNRRFRSRVEQKFSNRWFDFDAVYVHDDATLASKVAGYRPTVLRLAGPVTAELAPELRAVHAVCANGDALARIRAFIGDDALELPVGLDDQRFKPGATSVRSTLGWTNGQRIVGYVGRLTHLKGVDLLAAAFCEFSRVAADARLLIIGSGEEERNIRSTLAKELARGRVHFEPDVPHEQLPEWYRAMDVLVMPSRYENFSNAVVEAMACGVPVLASDIGGNRILAKTGAGWLSEPDSASSLVTSLGKVLKNCAELKARGKVGFNYVQNRYSWAATAERLERIFASHLGGH